MVKTLVLSIAVFISITSFALADTFGTGDNAFTIDFVPISGSSNPASGYGIVNNDYRMGTKEITNAQWRKFESESGLNLGNSYWGQSGDTIPVNDRNWYQSAQFVNWLNTSMGHQAAYKFIGSQGTNDYTFSPWDVTDAGYNASNPYRNSKAVYFLPTEDEWVKAAYWNGTSLQTYATKPGETLHQGDGINDWGWNYWSNGQATHYGPWGVGTGNLELNGTYDMMGNVWEILESPWIYGDYLGGSSHGVRGGSYVNDVYLSSSYRNNSGPTGASPDGGFRVASIPEPASLLLLGLGGLLIRKR